jgi:hypothetical protein
MDVDYYRRAVDRIAQQAGNPQLFAFSDDPDWCSANLTRLGHPLTIVAPDAGRPAWEDLLLMSACDHHVIANSSFSWWGAWLDRRPQAMVVAPRRWTLGQDDHSAVYAQGWTVL